jgi:hypothetical protein
LLFDATEYESPNIFIEVKQFRSHAQLVQLLAARGFIAESIRKALSDIRTNRYAPRDHASSGDGTEIRSLRRIRLNGLPPIDSPLSRTHGKKLAFCAAITLDDQNAPFVT